mgnify:FL=1|tara:strand:- start:112 stop:420 length:309 start_codon:yes stop_codon:yes gene_type:complete
MAVKADGVDLSATTAANVGQAGSSGGSYSVTIVNRSTSAVTVRLGLGTGSATFQDARYVLYDEPVAAKSSLTFSPIVAEGNDYIIAYSSASSVNAIMMGFDE